MKSEHFYDLCGPPVSCTSVSIFHKCTTYFKTFFERGRYFQGTPGLTATYWRYEDVHCSLKCQQHSSRLKGIRRNWKCPYWFVNVIRALPRSPTLIGQSPEWHVPLRWFMSPQSIQYGLPCLKWVENRDCHRVASEMVDDKISMRHILNVPRRWTWSIPC